MLRYHKDFIMDHHPVRLKTLTLCPRLLKLVIVDLSSTLILRLTYGEWGHCPKYLTYSNHRRYEYDREYR